MDIYVSKSSGLLTNYDKHRHSCWEIVIPVVGEGMLESRLQSFPFAPGCVYVMPPNVDHSLHSDQGFTDIYIQTDFLKLPRNKITVLYGLEQMPVLGEIIYSAYHRKETGRSGSVECALQLIAQIIYEELDSDPDSLPFQIRDFLIDGVSEPSLSMKTLSDRFGYNGDYIRRIFKGEFEITPMEYLNHLRLLKAKELLQNMPAFQLKEVAELCGFSDPFYFSRFFKKYVGIPPVRFKKLEKEKGASGERIEWT